MASLLPIMDMLEAAGEAKLSLSQLRTLLLLRDRPKDCTALSSLLGITGAAVTGLIDVLETRRLVLRSRTQKDRRLITVLITKEGEALLSTLTKHLAA